MFARTQSTHGLTDTSMSTQQLKANINVWDTLMAAMEPAGRQRVGNRTCLPVEIGPQLKHILQPTIKMQNVHLMSPDDKARLEAHASIMVMMGLSYAMRHDADAMNQLALEPAVDRLVTYPLGHSNTSPVPQELMKYLQNAVRACASVPRVSLPLCAVVLGRRVSPTLHLYARVHARH